jgi:glyoxylate/hydroxypyruvate reductase A
LLPLTSVTESILNKELFEKLPKGAYLINIARGEHLVEHDLLEMLDTGQLSGASLDVFRTEPLPEEHPFWKHPKVHISPHIASVTDPKKVAHQLMENYMRLNNREPLRNVVDLKNEY